MFPVSAAVREEAGVSAGDVVDVDVELDAAPRELVVPAELACARVRDPDARGVFENLSYTNRKRHVLAVEGAKSDQTKQRRIEKIVEELRA
jgi:uncharacterized protein YdeI (YjbR/CyaY-like superfamily)